MSATRKAKPETSSNILRQIMYGRVVNSDFFARNWMGMVLLAFVLLIYISGKYTCQTKMEEIRRLEHKLEVVMAERVSVRSSYMSRIRESSMQTLVKKMNLGLAVQDQPPYKIESKN